MAKTKPAWTVAKNLKVLREGILQDADELKADDIKDVKAWIKNPTKPNKLSPEGDYPGVVSVSLYEIGQYAAASGCERVFSGDPTGWEEIGLALPILYWVRRMELRLAIARHKRTKDVELLEDRLAFSIAFGLTFALGYDEGARWIANALLADVDSEKHFKKAWDWSPVPPFMYQLAARWLKRKVDTTLIKKNRKCAAYDDIWTHWKDPAKLGPALDAAAEYHISNGHTTRERDEMDFFGSIGEDLPWEVLIVLRLRRAEKLPDPTFTHPFLKCALMSPPDPMPFPRHELLDKAIAAGRVIFPDL